MIVAAIKETPKTATVVVVSDVPLIDQRPDASANFTAVNIKSGISLFGLTGSYSAAGATGNATTTDVFTGQTFSNATSTGLTGTLTLACATSTFDGLMSR